ncbi:TIGR00266 family protein [Saccharopolyspora gloriosae]|uniref:TIGR00266 family protein n=1 Tax=Saccharopolyspora gloriosae TaxID=455344 RepID=UPI001FB5B1BE|nr:TIGR00266 family protein [Saccharopolyspora gloriosae]
MQVRNRHTPTFGVARLLLAPGEPARIATGSMLATSYGVVVEARNGGLLKSLTRSSSAGGTTCTAGQQGGWVDVAPALPGDLHVLELDGYGWCVAGSAWLAAAAGVQLDEQWAGFKNLFGGERGFLRHVSGQGPVVLACYGALDVMTLQPGEFLTVDTGHVVAYGESVQTRLRQSGHGVAQSMKTGEGLVFDFAGPGQVLVQTRDPRSMVAWLQSQGLGSPRS